MGKLIEAGAGHSLAIAVSYIAVLVALAIILAFRVIGARYSERVSLGDGENRLLTRRIRAHGNFSEYAPLIALVLLALALIGAREWLMHLVGLTGLVGRVLHAVGLSRSAGPTWPRRVGMVLTFSSLAMGAAALLILAWS
jgi:uncharacterized protein